MVESLSLREKLPQVEMAAGDEAAALVFRVMAPPSADDVLKFEQFGLRHAVQIYLQSGGLESVRPLSAQTPRRSPMASTAAG